MKGYFAFLSAALMAAATCEAQSGSLITSGTVEMKMDHMLARLSISGTVIPRSI